MALLLLALPSFAMAQGAAPSASGAPPAGNAAPAAAAAPDDAGTGKQIFMADGCFECHGRVGQGDRFTGPILARTQLPLDAFVQQLRRPYNEMPPYEPGVLSDADAADIYAYLQSLPVAKSGKDIPLLNQ